MLNPMLQERDVTLYKQYTENDMMKQRQLSHQLSVKVPKMSGLELMQGPQPFDWNQFEVQ